MNQIKIGILLSYISLVLSNVIGILYTPFMLRMLGQSEYGLYSLVSSVVAYLTILDFGFGNAVVRYTAKYRAEKRDTELHSLFGMFILLFSLIGIIVFLVGLGLTYNVSFMFGNSMTLIELNRVKVMLILLVINLSVTFPFSLFGSIITAYENFVFQKMINIIRILLQPAIIIPILLMGYKAIAMVVIITVLNVICLLINCYYCFFRLNIKFSFSNLNWALLKEISSYSVFVFIGIIIDKIYWSTGQFILGAVVGTSSVAIYAVGIQLQGYYMNISSAISGAFLPKVTSLVSINSSDEELSSLFIKIGRIQYLILALVLSGFIIFGKMFVIVWAGLDYIDAYYIALIIMVPLTVPLSQCMGLIILQAKAKLKFRSFSYLVISILSLFVSIPLAKYYGGIGCAIGTSFCLLIGNGLVMNIYYKKKMNIDVFNYWKEIGRISFPILILIVLGFFLNELFVGNSILILGFKIALFSFLYICVIWKYSMNEYEKNLLRMPLLKFRSYFSRKIF